MDEFSWGRVPTRQRHFSSPLFTEMLPTSMGKLSGNAGESPLITDLAPFDRAVLSWNGEGNWRLEMRLQIAGKPVSSGRALTPYYLLGVLEGEKQRSATRTELSRDVLPASSMPVTVEIDTLALKKGLVATGFQIRAAGTGDLRSLTVAHYRRTDRRYTDRPVVSNAWGTIIPVPERCQRDVEEEPQIGGQVCSPTSLSMMLEYHGSRCRTIDVARAVRDSEANVYGNWPCNTGAVSHLLTGGWSAVAKMTGFAELEREIAAHRPVALSHRWQPGDLSNAPISRSSGHLIVAVGFTKDGDVVVNDPAAKAGEVRRVYKRRELFHTWQERGEGIAYLIHPLR